MNLFFRLEPRYLNVACLCRRSSSLAFDNQKLDEEHSSFVRITTPQRMDDFIRRRLVSRELQEAELERRRRLGTPIIACSRPAYNLFKGRLGASKNTPLTALASHGWKHPRSKGDQFTVHAFSKRDFFFQSELSGHATKRFSEMPINPTIISCLKQYFNIEQMSNIQELTFDSILNGENVHFFSENGSGKTLAYLIPLAELASKSVTPFERDVILVPSRELAAQVSNVVSKLNLPFFNETNCLVTTPKLFLRTFEPKSLHRLVIDEADTMLDDSFTKSLEDVLNVYSESLIKQKQIILSSATVPSNLQEVLAKFFQSSDFKNISTKRIHRLPLHISHKFVRCGPSQKTENIVKTVRKLKKSPAIIFCNRTPAVAFVVHSLIENGIPAEQIAALDSRLDGQERDAQWQAFCRGERQILVATDLASRGLDTPHVRHVINFDMPRQMSDYIHRSGRLGRVTSCNSFAQFQVTSLVTYPGDVEMTWQLETAARRAATGTGSEELPNVDANIKRKITEEISAKREQQQRQMAAMGAIEEPEVLPFPRKFLGEDESY